MTLPASGPISLQAVNVELGLPPSNLTTLNDALVRGLFGVSSGLIRMSDGYGKASLFLGMSHLTSYEFDERGTNARRGANWLPFSLLHVFQAASSFLSLIRLSSSICSFIDRTLDWRFAIKKSSSPNVVSSSVLLVTVAVGSVFTASTTERTGFSWRATTSAAIPLIEGGRFFTMS